MANASNPFQSRGTKVFHGVAAGAITWCRFVYRDTNGKVAACATGYRPSGVSPATYAASDDCDYHKLGIAMVETDGSAVVGEFVKAAADSSGKAIKDASPSYLTAGQLLTLDATTNFGLVELWV